MSEQVVMCKSLDIVCMATRRLNNPLPTNVQHLMRRLAMRHRVLYVEPPVDFVFLARHPLHNPYLRAGSETGMPQVLVPFILPWAHRIPYLEGVNQRLVVAQVRRRMKQLGFSRPILWFFSPLQAWILAYLGAARVCFHITDDYAAMPGVNSQGIRHQLEEASAHLLQTADYIFVTSPHLAKKLGLAGSRVHVVPNVADVDHFAAARDPDTVIPADIAKIRRPIAGFIGAVDNYKIDFEMLGACALATPDVSYVLIGPVGWGDPGTTLDSLDLPNVHVLGLRSYETMPRYLKAFDVGLIPYRKTAYTESCSPLKLYEYLAAGKPVVSTDLPGVRAAAGFVTRAERAADFAAAIRHHVHDDPRLADQRAAFAAKHSWPQRVSEIEAILTNSDMDDH
ncbi:MAG: glycosyltransferase family 1 protein [Nitrospirae bacterium]|nr:MAG: glycosyltransferase family 1 protein [Nitrospirota bacterium]